MFNKKNVLVTGGTGLIGTPLIKNLMDAGANIRVAALNASTIELDNVDKMECDLTSKDDCLKCTKDMDMVFHLASPKGSSNYAVSHPNFFYVNNILLNTYIIESARLNKVERLLYTSTMHVYPDMGNNVSYKESDANVDNGWNGQPAITNHKYGLWAKRMGELHAKTCAIEFGWDKIAIVRPTVIYGPGDNFKTESALLIPTLIKQCMSNQNPIEIFYRHAGRDFLYCTDVADGMMLAMEKYCNCQPINLGSGQVCTAEQIIGIIMKITGCKSSIKYLNNDISDFKVLDISLAKSLGFSPKVSLEDGIEKTINWLRIA